MRIIAIIMACFIAIPCVAAAPVVKEKTSAAQTKPKDSCAPTPKLPTTNYPGMKNIPPGNNLLKPAGKSIEAEGQKLLLMGRLLDKNCVPVANATVEIWQADASGQFLLATEGDRATPNPAFAGAGRTYTDNEGNFTFITAIPGAVKSRAPNIQLRVDADSFAPFSTVLFFSDGIKEQIPAIAREKLVLAPKPFSANPEEGMAAPVMIILPGETPYRGY